MRWISKLMTGLVLVAALIAAGCGGGGGGAEGDTNDPAVTGDDEAQMDEPEGTVDD